jgi:acyl-CoA synthetase (AMP-forming)/AMP-acid ligase II
LKTAEQAGEMTMAAVVGRLAMHGDRTALIAGERIVSYRCLAEDADRLANALLELGIRHGERFAFAFPNGIEIVLCYLACARAGIVGVPLSMRSTPAELAFQLRDSGAVAVAYHERIAAAIEGSGPHPTVLAFSIGPGGNVAATLDELIAGGATGPPAVQPQPDDPFCVMYTGGTTGAPKAAVQTQKSWAACVETVVEEWQLRPEDRHLVVLPMSHVAWFTAAAQLHAGATAILADRWVPDDVLELVERERLTTLNMIPTMLGDLLQAHAADPSRDLSSLRLLTVAGSPTPEEMLHRAHAAFGPIIGNIYGMTETSGPVTYLLPAEMAGERLRSGGRAGRNVELVVLGDAGQVLYGEPGEIALAGPQVSPSYLNQPEESESVRRHGWFLTGDVGYLDDDGFVFVVDRRKDMIISGGYNIYSKEVEEIIYAHPDVVEAAVVGLPDPKWIEAVHAFVVVRAGSSTTADELRDHCRRELAPYKVPKGVHFEEKLPRTSVGKFDKRALRARYSTEPTSVA